MVFHAALKNLGGGEAVAAWTLQALKDDYHLTVFTWEPATAEELNRVFGTSLVSTDFRVVSPAGFIRQFLNRVGEWNRDHAFQKTAWMYRFVRQRAHRFDLCISTYDEASFGRPGIQYIHYPGLIDLHKRFGRRPDVGAAPPSLKLRWLNLKKRLRPWRLLSGFSFQELEQNVTLANSRWTAQVVRDHYGIQASVLYPPVAGDFGDVAWDRRAERFVCVGRFAPPKRLDMVIRILAAVRARGYDIRLELIGLLWDDPEARETFDGIQAMVREHAAWLTVHVNVDRAALIELVANSRYGIHAQTVEPFGIAPAEMVQAGCITFTSAVGGQTEIVGDDPRLVFDNEDDAVEKIAAVLGNPGLQATLRERLSERRQLYTADHFVKRMREVVADFLAG